jgi:N4-gp56 family major capsid protein
MAINYAEKYSAKVDERFKLGSLVGGVVNKDYDFTGVKTVKVYSIATATMNDYQRSGLARYGEALDLGDTVQELTITQDRAFTFVIDKGDELEQAGAKNAGAALRRQLDEVVIPEYDKYVIGKVVGGAGKTETSAITNANAYDAFLAGAEQLDENKVPTVGRVALVTPAYLRKLKADDNFVKASDLGQQVAFTGQVGAVDGTPIIKVPASYFPANVEFVITHPVATTAPVKIQEYKIHQDAPGISGALAEGRFLYDGFVLNNKKGAIYVHKNA